MVRVGSTRHENRSRATKYLAVGRSLHATARDLDTMGELKYGNGLAIIVIHAVIAYTDALAVAFREIKSTDGEHVKAADVLVQALGPRADADQVRRVRRVLSAKSHASYSGNYYTLDDGRTLLQELERFDGVNVTAKSAGRPRSVVVMLSGIAPAACAPARVVIALRSADRSCAITTTELFGSGIVISAGWSIG